MNIARGLHSHIYIDSVVPIDSRSLTGKGDAAECCATFHEAYRWVLGAVAWTVLSWPDLAAHVQALQRRTHAPHIPDCKDLNVLIRYMERRKCGLNSVDFKHPLELVAFIDAAFETQLEEPIGLARRGLAAILCEDRRCDVKPNSSNGEANPIDSTVRRQRRVVRSTFGADLNGLVDSIEQMVSLQRALHHIYCGAGRSPQRMIDLLESGNMYPPLDLCAGARAAYDAIAATDVCEPAGSSLKLHLISVRDRMTHGLVRQIFWADATDMLADGLTKSSIDRTLLHNMSNDCRYQAIRECLEHRHHAVVGSATSPPKEEPPEKEEF